MIVVTTTLVEGTGTLPKNLNTGAVVNLDVSEYSRESYLWEWISIPDGSTARIRQPTDNNTDIGPLDVVGVYNIKIWFNRTHTNEEAQTLSLAVPGAVSPIPLPPTPSVLES